MVVTVQDVMNYIIEPVGKLKKTVDTLKAGSPNMEVTGIAVTFMPTQSSINQAIELGVNLLITHEGLYFSHSDDHNYGENSVEDQKRQLIEDSGIAIFRVHDYIHHYQPDGIMVGLIEALGWESYVTEHLPTASLVTTPAMDLKEIIDHIKTNLGLNYLRYVGEPSMPVKKIGITAGYRGGGSLLIPLFEEHELDIVLYGEGFEWETPEYVRDAVSQGHQKGIIVLGHAESEEPGMKFLANLLEKKFNPIPIHFISTQQIFSLS